MSIQKAQSKIKKLANWLNEREWDSTKSLFYDLNDAQAKIDRITNRAIDATVRSMDRFIEQAALDSRNSELTARERQMAKTELKRLHETKRELEGMI